MKPGNHQFFSPSLAGLIGFALLLISATGALAQTTNTWTGQTGSDWNTAANWSRTAVPGTGDDVVIPAGTTSSPLLSTTAVAKSVEVQSGASLTISTTGSLTVTGGKSYSGITRGFSNSGQVRNEGQLVLGNTGSISEVGVYNVSSFTNTAGGNIQIDRSVYYGLVHNGGSFVNQATIIIGAGTGTAITNLGFSGVFNNQGCQALINSLGNAVIAGSSSFSNTGTIIERSSNNSSIGYNGGLVQNLNSGNFSIGSGNAVVTGAGLFWRGCVSSDWNTAANWSAGTLPTATDDVVIPAGTTNAPLLSTTAVAKSVEVQTGASLTISSSGSLSINGSKFYSGITRGFSNSGQVRNEGQLVLGNTSSPGAYGLYNEASFTNTVGGSIFIDKTSYHALSNSGGGTFVNQATITIGASAIGLAIANTGVINNQGCQALINMLGNTVISDVSSFSNTGTIIERSSNNSIISYNGGLVQDLNGGTFSIGSGNAVVTSAGLFWRGCVSSDWNTAANWSAGTLPTATDDVTIPAGTANSPVLSTTAVAKSVEVRSGASFTISSSGSLSINGSKSYSGFTRGFSNSGQVRNAGQLVLGNTGSVGAFGLYNAASFTNTDGGVIRIDRAINYGLNNNTGGSFVNSATIVIGATAGTGVSGLYNIASFNNTARGTILIDNVDNNGIRNESGSFVNSATVIIGSGTRTATFGVYNTASFSNTTGGLIQIDKTTEYGLNNNAGSSFVNSASVIIGANASVGNFGLYNTSSFSNTTGGILQIDGFSGSGLYTTGTFVNSATIAIGSRGTTGYFGLDNYSTFTNTAGGFIQIEGFTDSGLRNGSGSFVNSATITIGSIASTQGPFGIQNRASFTNTTGALIQIDKTSSCGMLCLDGSFINSATIKIGSIASIGSYGIRNLASFTNTAGGSIQIDRSATDGLANNVNTFFINSATITIGASATGNAISTDGVFDNQGCQALINSLGNAVISGGTSFSNTGTVIERSSGNSSISYNGGLVQNLNGGTFAITSGQPPLSVSATGLTTCNPANGSFTIAGVQPATAYTLSYTVGNTTASLALTGNSAGQLSAANLSGGTYALALSGSCVAQTLPLSATLSAPSAFTLTTQPPATSVVCAGAAVSATVGVSGTTAPVTYQWYKNTLASPVASQTAAILSLTNLTTAESGSYFVVITDNCSSATSTAFSLTVNTISGFTVSSATVCPGQSANLTASGCSGQILWSTGATTAMITLTAGSSTSLLTATCTAGVCSATANGQVVVGGIQPPPAQILSFTADESACPVRLTGRGAASSFTMTGPKDYVFSTVYREGATHDAVGLNVKQAGTYTLTATYTNSCGTSEPVTRTVAVGRNCP